MELKREDWVVREDIGGKREVNRRKRINRGEFTAASENKWN